MCCPEIIGIIGTLLGTILGWALNEFSKRGKLMIYPNWQESFQHQDEYGGFVDCHTLEEARWYSYKLSLDLHNSSGDSKIMREISIGFFQDRKELFKEIPYDDSTGRGVGDIRLYDNVRSLTIPPKSIMNIQLHGGLNDNDEAFSKLCEVNRIVLIYRDEKNKSKTVTVKK